MVPVLVMSCCMNVGAGVIADESVLIQVLRQAYERDYVMGGITFANGKTPR